MSKKTKAARAQKIGEEETSFSDLQERYDRLMGICRRLKAREGRLALGCLAVQVAYKKQDSLAVNKFVTDLLRGDLSEAMSVISDRDLAMRMALVALGGAEKSIREKRADDTGADYIAETLAAIRKMDPYFDFIYDSTKPENTHVHEAVAQAQA